MSKTYKTKGAFVSKTGIWENPGNANNSNANDYARASVSSASRAQLKLSMSNIVSEINSSEGTNLQASSIKVKTANLVIRALSERSSITGCSINLTTGGINSSYRSISYTVSSITNHKLDITDYFTQYPNALNSFEVEFIIKCTDSTEWYLYIYDIYLELTYEECVGSLFRYAANPIGTVKIGNMNVSKVFLGERLIFTKSKTLDNPSSNESSDATTSLTDTALANVAWSGGVKINAPNAVYTNKRYKLSDIMGSSTLTVKFAANDTNSIQYLNSKNVGFYINLWSDVGHDTYIDFFHVENEVERPITRTGNYISYTLTMDQLRALSSKSNNMNISTAITYIAFGFFVNDQDAASGSVAAPASSFTLTLTKN